MAPSMLKTASGPLPTLDPTFQAELDRLWGNNPSFLDLLESSFATNPTYEAEVRHDLEAYLGVSKAALASVPEPGAGAALLLAAALVRRRRRVP